jgi:hypothetical protein
MKAKDWVKHISQLQPDTPEHDAAAEACAKECREIFQMRVKSIRGGGKGSFFRDQTSDRRAGALQFLLPEEQTMLFKKPRLIQRLSSRSRNAQVKFSERYHFDVLEGDHGRRVIDALGKMHKNLETTEISLHGIPIYLAWNVDNYDREGAALVLDQLWNRGLLEERLEQPTYFCYSRYQEQQGLEKQRRQLKQQYAINAWLDVEHGLFWTWEKIRIEDIAINIAKSMIWLEKTPEERRAENFAGREKPTLAAQLGPLKDQLIQTGKLSPRRE